MIISVIRGNNNAADENGDDNNDDGDHYYHHYHHKYRQHYQHHYYHYRHHHTIPCKTAPQYDHAFQPLTKKTLPLQVDGTDDNLGKKRRLFCIQTSI